MQGMTVAIKPVNKNVNLPKKCPCCMGFAESSDTLMCEWYAAGGKVTASLRVPIYTACLAHKKRAERTSGYVLLVGLAAIILGIVGYSTKFGAAGLLCIVLLAAAAVIERVTSKSYKQEARAMLKPNCSSLRAIILGKIVAGKSKGEVLLTVGNASYASELATLNNGRILSGREVKELGLRSQEV